MFIAPGMGAGANEPALLRAMATSCLLRFAEPNTSRHVQLYKHYDGNPQRVVPALQQLRTILIATDCVRGPTYAAAQFISVKQVQTLLEAGSIPTHSDDVAWMTSLSQPWALLGLGVIDSTDTVPPSVEYAYRIQVPPLGGTEEWTLEVSTRLDLDAPTPPNDLYDDLTWDRSGPLRFLD